MVLKERIEYEVQKSHYGSVHMEQKAAKIY